MHAGHGAELFPDGCSDGFAAQGNDIGILLPELAQAYPAGIGVCTRVLVEAYHFALDQEGRQRRQVNQGPEAMFHRQPFIFEIGVRVEIIIDKAVHARCIEVANRQFQERARHEPVEFTGTDIGTEGGEVDTALLHEGPKVRNSRIQFRVRQFIRGDDGGQRPEPVANTDQSGYPRPERLPDRQPQSPLGQAGLLYR